MKGLAVAALAVLLGACRPEGTPGDAPESAATPTQVMRDFELTDINGGKKQMVLISTEARLFEATHMAELEKPDVSFFRDGKRSSRLVAPKGRVDTESHDMEAWGGVVVTTEEQDRLDSQTLRYDPRRNLIVTADPVRLERKDSITKGIGLESDPQLQNVKIGKQTVTFK